MSEPAQLESPQTADAPVENSSESFISSIDAAFDNIGSFDDVEEIRTPIDDGVEDTNQNENNENNQPEGDDGDYSDDVDVTDWTPEAARVFKNLRNDLKNERNTLRELTETLEQRENRIKELESFSPEVDTLRQKIDEYESKLLVTRVEDTAAYKTLIEEPLRDIVSQSDQIADKYGVDPEQFFSALTLQDEAAQEEAISELLSSATERDRFKAYQLIEQLKPIAAQRDALRENSTEAMREIQELEQLRQREEAAYRMEHRKELANQIADRITSKLTFIKDFEGVDVKSIVKEAEATDHTLLPPVKAVYNQIAAELFPKVAREYVRMVRERDGLISKLAKYDSASPRVGGQPNSSGQVVDSGLSLVDAINKHFGA
jgi:hypothetical protein